MATVVQTIDDESITIPAYVHSLQMNTYRALMIYVRSETNDEYQYTSMAIRYRPNPYAPPSIGYQLAIAHQLPAPPHAEMACITAVRVMPIIIEEAPMPNVGFLHTA